GRNLCYNDDRAFLNNETCPNTFLCVCSDCYYGRECKFATKGFIFSLDPILGYHIKPNISLGRQPFIVKFSIIITTTMLISELIMGSWSVAIFRLKKSRKVGCGYYLLVSSINSMIMILLLTYKFWQLVLSQMSYITHRSILLANCVSTEVILKSCLASNEWLDACVAIERMLSVIKGVSFDKNRSRTIAKRVIFPAINLIMLTHVHEPLHRQLINDLDEDQQRIWCLSSYSPIMTKYNTFITLFHYIGSFSINLISALTIIIVAARNRFKVESGRAFKKHF
ncbi:unnamed protein product, partial [Rotaria socialis]